MSRSKEYHSQLLFTSAHCYRYIASWEWYSLLLLIVNVICQLRVVLFTSADKRYTWQSLCHFAYNLISQMWGYTWQSLCHFVYNLISQMWGYTWQSLCHFVYNLISQMCSLKSEILNWMQNDTKIAMCSVYLQK
jgi:hypothetical protein